MIKKSQEHLNSVNESYAEHMSMALIHGLIPEIFQRNASNE